jgi:hypothetical protein
MMNKSSKMVFISYAREDEDAAKRLYKDLQNRGLEPWLDKEAILPGYNWKLAIHQAIKNSRFFIPLISSKSAGKIGYIQNELKYAIEASKNFPEKEVFMIPAKLDDCEMPYQTLEEIQSVDLFPDWNSGINQIFKTFKEKGIAFGQASNEAEPSQIKKEDKWQSGLSEDVWNNLLTSIYNKTCIPFIGSGIFSIDHKDTKSLNSICKEIIKNWREKYRYPLEDLYTLSRADILEEPNQMARLAQFLEIERSFNQKLAFPKSLLKDLLTDIGISELLKEGSPYDILARLDLPIYMTTNYDKFMEQSLSKDRTKSPQSEFCRWNDDLLKYARKVGIPSVFNKKAYEPTSENPLVYHILGDIEIPKSMVLTEKEYFHFMVELNKNDDIIPTKIQKKLQKSTLLFVGYNLEDINFRAIFQGLLNFLGILSDEERKISIAVQIPPSISSKDQLKMQKYIDKYFTDVFQINVSWQNLSEFLIELDKRWEDFKSKIGTKSSLPAEGR